MLDPFYFSFIYYIYPVRSVLFFSIHIKYAFKPHKDNVCSQVAVTQIHNSAHNTLYLKLWKDEMLAVYDPAMYDLDLKNLAGILLP